MKANVLTVMKMENGINVPSLPPMSDPSGYCLHYTEGGILKGGYGVLNDAPATPNTCIIQVECSDIVFADMIDDPTLDIQWWEELPEETPI